MYCLTMNTPYIENAAGRINAQCVLYIPISLNIRNFGTIKSCGGIIIVARYNRKILSLPGNLSFAKPYPAKIDVVIASITENAVTLTEFNIINK